MLTSSGHLDTVPPRTIQTSRPRHPVHLPARNFHIALHGLNSDQVTHNISGGRAFGWQARLDGSEQKRSASVDRTHSELEAEMEHEDGTLDMIWRKCETKADGQRALHTGVARP